MSSTPLIEILDNCTACRSCVEVCPRYLFKIENKKSVIANFDPCHDCGHCVAVCPEDAIIHHRMIEHSLEEDFPLRDEQISYDQILENIRQRRSIRLFTRKKVTNDEINKLIQLGRYAPTGHNARKVCYSVIDGREEIEYILDNMIDLFKRIKKRLNSIFWTVLIYLLGKSKSYNKARKSLYRLESHIYHWEQGIDKVFHNSSTVILIHAHKDVPSPIEDCNIAAQNIMLGAQSLGLGATYIGYLLKSWDYSSTIKKIIDLPEGHILYATLAIGTPKNNFKRLVPRPEPKVIEWIRK
ncbi:MAG: nitroreductase family protein [Candidatus Heimdallarchaeaceae archaeon]|jgi:nitroreductase/NAD-dependent dihydropyrimidine dehydrogenase PreA subunit